MIESNVLRAGDGCAYRGAPCASRSAGGPELDRALALTETVAKKNEEPHTHIHGDEDGVFLRLKA